MSDLVFEWKFGWVQGHIAYSSAILKPNFGPTSQKATTSTCLSCVVFLVLVWRLVITESTLPALINRSKPQLVLDSVPTGH